MDQPSLEFLKALLISPSPSGYERPIQDVVRKFVEPFAATVTTDWHGNVIAAVNPEGRPRIMLAGHCDQIGLMVKHIDDKGFIRVDGYRRLGHADAHRADAAVSGRPRGPSSGSSLASPFTFLPQDERKSVPEIKDLWIDIGAQDRRRRSARNYVAVGDPVTLELGFDTLRNDIVAGPGMDNRVGVWVVMPGTEAGRGSQAASRRLFGVSTVQEEIGLRGARTAPSPSRRKLASPSTSRTPPTARRSTKIQFGRVKLGKGPVVYRGPNVNPIVFQRLTELAKQHDIPIQPNGISVPASNDANVLQLTRGGTAAGIVAIPNRYMHSPVEMVSLPESRTRGRTARALFACR